MSDNAHSDRVSDEEIDINDEIIEAVENNQLPDRAGSPVGDVVQEVIEETNLHFSDVSEAMRELFFNGVLYQPSRTTVADTWIEPEERDDDQVMSDLESAPVQVVDSDLYEVTALDDANLLGHLDATEGEPLEKGEIVSPSVLADLTEEFQREFGDTDARLSFVRAEGKSMTLVCLRPWTGDGNEAVVMPVKVEA